MKDLLLIIHSARTTVGTADVWCAMRGISFDVVVASSMTFENLKVYRGYRALLLFGGDMEAWEVDKYPWLRTEKDLIQYYVSENRGVFGICLGSQLLAEALGSKITDMGGWEFGWFPVELYDDSLLVPFHCHSSRFDLPPASQRLASDRFDGEQGFTARRNKLVGFQFHPEIDEKRLGHILSGLNDSPPGRAQSKDEIETGFAEYGELLKNWFFRQLDGWWESVKAPRRSLPPRLLHRL